MSEETPEQTEDAATAESHEAETSAAPASGDALVDEICANFAGCGWDNSLGQRVVICPRDQYLGLAEWLKSDRGFAMCVDITSVDYLDHWDRSLGTYTGDTERFEIVANLLDLDEPSRLRIRVPIPENDTLCPTIAYVYPSADAQEREIYDLMGIVFEGHPDLTRILMPDDWEGHPLRKDYPKAHIPVTFKDDDKRPEDVVAVPVDLQTRKPTGDSRAGEANEGDVE